MRPKILIVTEEGYASDIPHFILNNDYVHAVKQAGGLPLPGLEPKSAADYLELADGLLLIGGPDIHRGRYGEVYTDPEPIKLLSLRREVFEFDLCRRFLQAKKPIFGIGRGMQIINVALGGTLHLDIPGHQGEPDPRFPLKAAEITHPVTLSAGETMQVNSCHHQAVKDLGEGLQIFATAEDGIIEGIEHASLPCFGVQWHPERTNDLRLFDRFLAHCREVEA